MSYTPPSALIVNFGLKPVTPSRTANFEFISVGRMKVWTEGAWTLKPIKYWDGSSWVQKPLKYWTGSTWTTAP